MIRVRIDLISAVSSDRDRELGCMYPRLAYNVWRLIARAVTAAFPEERQVKPGTLPLMEASVLRGLHFLAQHWAGCRDMAPDLLAGDVKAAIDWLGEANEVPLDITLEDEAR